MEGWNTVPLAKCLQRIGTPKKIPRKQFEDAGRFPIVSQEREFTNGYWSDEADVVHVKSPLVVFGDHTQTLKYIDFDFVVGADGVKLLQPEPFLDPKYFYYFLMAHPVKSLGYARHFRLLKELEIVFPELLREQERIVAILDEAFAAIATATANAEKNLANARELFESQLHCTFSQRGEGWAEKSLEAIGTTQTGSTPKTSDQSNYGTFISFVKPGDFNANGTLEYDKAGLSESGARSARRVPAGSVLMVCIGATIGKCGYSDQDVATNQQVNALTPSDGSSNRFIYYQMLTKAFQRRVIHASGQATLPIINKSKWSALTVWLPPTVEEQAKIAARLQELADETQRLASNYERHLAHLTDLKQSLLHKAFTGELTADSKAADRTLSEANV